MNHSINNKHSSLIPMLIIGGLFFIFGFVTWLNGSLIPFLQIVCDLNHVQAYFVTLVFYIAYTVTALPMAKVLKRTGYKNGMMLGLLIMAIGSLLFIPAALLKTYTLFLFALFVLGTGLTILQTASNPYIVLIGPKETAAVRISVMGILNKSAGMIAPIIFTAIVFSDISQFNEARLAGLSEAQRLIELKELSSRLITPYIIMASILATLSFAIKLSPLPEPTIPDDNTGNKAKLLKQPHLVLGVITLFFYIGAEVIAGDTIGLFGKELGVRDFAQLTSYTMAFMVMGYIIGMIVIPKLCSQEFALSVSAILGVILSFFIIFSDPSNHSIWNHLLFWISDDSIPNTVLFVALLGLANALVWPAVWPLTLKDLGKDTEAGSALLIMSISGGALLPLVYGIIVDASHNPQLSYAILIPCYLFILFYACKGHKIRAD